MTTAKPANVKTRTVVLLIVVYTFLTNIGDVRKGLVDGWNAVKVIEVK